MRNTDKDRNYSSDMKKCTLILVMTCTMFSAGFAFGEEAVPPAVEADEQVRIGVLAKRGSDQCLEQWGATAEYLTREIPGHSFSIIPLGFDEIHMAVDSREVEFFLANSSVYVDLEVRHGAMRIATLKNLHMDGTVHKVFAGVIFCRADREDIQNIQDLKSKVFMAVDERSCGGWHMGWRELLERGIDPYHDFADMRFGGTHDAVVYAVRDGDVDAGTVRSDALERMALEGKIQLEDFRILIPHENCDGEIHFLHSTQHYPEWPIAKSPHTSDELAEQVAIALIRMPPSSQAAQDAWCAGWTIPQNYQPVHEMLMAVRFSPYEDYGKVTLRDALRQYRFWLLGILILTALIVLFTVLTSRLRMKLEQSELVRKERDKLTSILESMHDGVYIVNGDYEIQYVNRALMNEFGPPDGKKCYEYLHDSDEPCTFCKIEDVLAGRTVRWEWISPKSGKVYDLIDTPLKNLDGSISKLEIFRDITKRKLAEKEAQLNKYRIKTRLKLHEMVWATEKEIMDFSFEEMLNITESKIGYIAFMNEEETVLTMYSWSAGVMKECTVAGKPIIYPVEDTGLWGEAVRQRKTVITNDYSAPNPLKKGIPDGHVKVVRHMNVPVFDGDRIVMVAGVGNKEVPYNDSDANQLTMMMSDAWQLVIKRRAEEALRESEARLNEAQRLAQIGNWGLDLIMNTLYWSDEVYRMFDLAPQEFGATYEAFLDNIHPDDREFVNNAYTESLKNKTPYNIVHRLLLKNGTVKFVNECCKTFYDDAGKALRSIGTVQDITERELAKEALKESERRLKDSQQIARIGQWELDLVSNHLYWSEGIYGLFEVDPDKFTASFEAILDSIHPEDREYVKKAYSESVKNKMPYNIIHRLLLKDETIKYVNEICRTEYDKDGNPLRSIGTVQDITELKEAEEELQKYRQQLEELVESRTAELHVANKDLEAFAYSVSHDLRAPLRAINGFTGILMEDYVEKLDAEGKRLGEIIQHNTRKMGQLIDDLLTFSRMGRAAIRFSEIDMKNMVNAVYHDAASPEERKRIDFSVADLPQAVGDSTMMRQLWMNLISNAIKFSSHRRQAVIFVSCQEEENKLTYSIEDNGVGFDMKYKDKLFGVFQRLHSTKEFEGTGVGLALVQRIVHRHGGEVWGNGEVDHGATFCFSLPIIGVPNNET